MKYADMFRSIFTEDDLKNIIEKKLPRHKSLIVLKGYTKDVLAALMESGDIDAAIERLKAEFPEDKSLFNRRSIKAMVRDIREELEELANDIRVRGLINNIEESKILSIKKREYIQRRMLYHIGIAEELAERTGDIKHQKLILDMYAEVLKAIDSMDEILGVKRNSGGDINVNIDNREISIINQQREALMKRLKGRVETDG